MNSNISYNEEHQEDEEIRCRVCSYFFSSLTKPYLLPCNHNLCLHCIDNLIKIKKTFCPICKTAFNKNDKSNFQVNYAFLNLVLKILKSKIILCKKCNKIYTWTEHSDKCDQKYFTNTNEMLSGIKKLCEECFSIIKYINHYKFILSNCKNEIYESIHFSINKMKEKFLLGYSNFIEKLFLSNITQINIENSKKEIMKFLEICKDNPKLFNNIDLNELNNLLFSYNNLFQKNKINKYLIFENEKNLSKNRNKSTLIKKTKRKIFENHNSEKKDEDNEEITINYDDEYNEYNKVLTEEINNKSRNLNLQNKNIFDFQNFLDEIDEPKVNKIIVGIDGVKIYSDNKKIHYSSQKSFNFNNNLNLLSQSINTDFTSNNNFDNLNQENSLKIYPNGEKKLNFIKKRNIFYSQNQTYLNNHDIQKINIDNEYSNSIDLSYQNNNLYKNNNINNNKKNKSNLKKENEIQSMNKIIKNFNKIKDILNKINKYSNEYSTTNSLLINEINSNLKIINPKIVSDYCLLLKDITYNYHQSYKRYLLSYIENTTIISLYDTHLEKLSTKDFRETLKGFPSLNHSISVIFDDFDLFFISGGIDFANYDSSNLLLSFRWSSMKIEFIDKIPQKIAFHSSIFFNNNLYLIGGMGEKNNYLIDCYCFHITNKKWEKMPNLNISRLNPSLCIYNNNYLYAIRGTNKIESIDSIEFINIKNMDSWILFKPFDPGFSWFGCDSSLAITISENQILIFGGRDRNGKLFHHSFILNTDNKTVYRGKDILISANFKFGGSVYQDKVIAIDWKNSNNNNKNHGIHTYDIKKKKWFFKYK